MQNEPVRLRRLPVALIVAAALAIVAPPRSAQWSSTPHVAGNPVFEDGFQVIHENALGINVFSAASRKWTTVSPPGSALIGFGDWTTLIREGNATFVGYSARRNASAAITLLTAPLLTLVHDDVALVVAVDPVFGVVAWAYSAVHNAWVSMALGAVPTPADVVISRFVIAIRDGSTYHGFAARTGVWTSLPLLSPGGPPAARTDRAGDRRTT